MAIKSMTGFGRGELENQGRVWSAEIRCVNNRYLDLKMKLPRGYGSLEEKMRKQVSKTHLRGRVDLYVSVTGDFSDLQQVKVNTSLAAGYKDALENLARTFDLEADLRPEILAGFPDVVVREQQDEDVQSVFPILQEVVEIAQKNCDEMRLQEGEVLAKDLIGRLAVFTRTVDHIEAAIPQIVEQRQKQLEERLEKILGNVQLDPARLAQEVAVMADKTDVTEEIVRLRSHIEQFQQFLNNGKGIGRKLDFLIQEFLREVNTLASKINDASIAHHTVELKSELEKMREQVQNIE